MILHLERHIGVSPDHGFNFKHGDVCGTHDDEVEADMSKVLSQVKGGNFTVSPVTGSNKRHGSPEAALRASGSSAVITPSLNLVFIELSPIRIVAPLGEHRV